MIGPASRALPVMLAGIAVAGCGQHPGGQAAAASAAKTAGPGITVQEYMEQQINPAAEYSFRSVRDVADEKGRRLEQPRTSAEWKEVEAKLEVLQGAPTILTAANLRVAPPNFRSENPAVESEPAAIQAAIDKDRGDFDRRAYRLQVSATEALLAARARDAVGMVKTLEAVDRACESCHLRYFYPGDARAQQAAREAYIMN